MATQRLTFFKFVPQADFDLNNMLFNLLQLNSSSTHCLIEEQSTNHVKGCYLVEKLKNETQYNINKGEFEIVSVSKLSILKFEIILVSHILIIIGSRNDISQFITVLTESSRNKCIIDNKEIDFKQLLGKLIVKNNIVFNKMRINNVIIDQGLVANCSVNLLDLDNCKDLINKYRDNISQLSLSLGKSSRYEESPSVNMTIFSSGSIVLYKDWDDIPNEIIFEILSMIEGDN